MIGMEERFSTALHGTARAWRQLLDRRMRDLGVSQAGWTTIALVAKARTPLSQSELAGSLGVEGPSMVAMLDRLQKAGLIVREQSAADRRVKLVRLTDDGKLLYRQVRDKAAAFRSELLRGIDSDQLAVATALLERLQADLESKA